MQASASPSKHPDTIIILFILALLAIFVESWFAIPFITPVFLSRSSRDSL